MGSPGCAAISCVSGVFASGSLASPSQPPPLSRDHSQGQAGRQRYLLETGSADHGAVPAPVLLLVWPKRTRFSPERAGGPVRRSWRPR